MNGTDCIYVFRKRKIGHEFDRHQREQGGQMEEKEEEMQ